MSYLTIIIIIIIITELESWTARNTTNGGMCTLFEERTRSIDSVTARDTKIRVQEKLLSDFKSEIEQQKRVIHEAMLGAEVQDQRINTLEQELTSLKEVNASLMEDNESYQILLHEKTMAGEFSKVKRERKMEYNSSCLSTSWPSFSL